MKKRILSFLLALCMVFSNIPVTFAEEVTEATDAVDSLDTGLPVFDADGDGVETVTIGTDMLSYSFTVTEDSYYTLFFRFDSSYDPWCGASLIRSDGYYEGYNESGSGEGYRYIIFNPVKDETYTLELYDNNGIDCPVEVSFGPTPVTTTLAMEQETKTYYWDGKSSETFDVSLVYDAGTLPNATWTSSDENVAVPTNDGSYCYFDIAGYGTTIITAEADGLTASMELTIAPYIDLNPDGESSVYQDFTVDSNSKAYCTFTAPSDGLYDFVLHEVETEEDYVYKHDFDMVKFDSEGYIEYMDSVYDVWGPVSRTITYELTAGTTYRIGLYNYYDTTRTAPLEIKPTEIATEIVILESYQDICAMWDGQNTSVSYHVECDCVPMEAFDVYTWESSDPSIAEISGQNGDWCSVLPRGYGTVTLTVTGKYSGMSASTTFTVNEMPTFSGSEEIALNGNSNMEYIFTPAESGYYNVKSTYAEEPEQGYGSVGFDAQMKTSEGYWMSELRTTYENGYCLRTYYLEANTKYTLRVQNGYSFPMTRQVDVYSAPAATGFTLDYEGGDLYRTESDFESGITHFTQATFEPVDAYMELTWTSINEDVIQIWSQNSGGCYWRAVGYGEATLTAATADGSMSASVTFNVRDLPNFDEDGDTVETVTIGDSEERWFYYTPATTGMYNVNTYCVDMATSRRFEESVYDMDGNWVYSPDDTWGPDNAYHVRFYSLEAGKQYKVRFANWTGEELTADVQIVPSPAITELYFGEALDTSIFWDGESEYSSSLRVDWQPQVAWGELTWTSSNSEVITLEADEYNRHYCYYQVAGYGTSTITVSCGDVSHSINITVASYPEMNLDEGFELWLDYDAETYYTFTPETTDYYNFHAEVVNEDYGYCIDIYDQDGQWLDGNWDTVTCKLNAGQRYKIRFWNDWKDEPVIAKVSLAPAPEGISLEQEELTIYWDNDGWYEYDLRAALTPETAAGEITWSVDTDAYLSELWTSENDTLCYFSPKAYGDTVITATITHGDVSYSAQCTVHVVPLPEISLEKTGSMVIYPEIASGTPVEYLFTTDVDGYHVFYAPFYWVNDWDYLNTLHVDIRDSNGNYVGQQRNEWLENGFRTIYDLNAGEQYKLRFYNYDCPTMVHEIQIGKAQEPTELVLSQSEIDVTWLGDEHTYYEISPVAGEDIFAYSTEEVTWTTSDASVVEIDGSQYHCQLHIVGYGTATITATLGNTSATCVVNVTEPESLNMGVNEVQLPAGGRDAYFHFTPETDGWYKIWTPRVYIGDGDSVIPNFSVVDIAAEEWMEGDSWGDEEGRWVYYKLTGGTKYRVSAWQWYDSAIDTYFDITKCDTAESIELNTTVYTMYWDGESELDGRVNFNVYPETAFTKLNWVSSNEKVAAYNYGSYTYMEFYAVGYGETTFTGTTDEGLEISFKVIIAEPEEIEVGYSEEITLPAGATVCYSFTPETSGWYTMSFPALEDDYGYSFPNLSVRVDGQYVDAGEYFDDSNRIYYRSFQAEAGNTYTLLLNNGYYDVAHSGIFTLDHTPEATEITIQEERNLWFDPENYNESVYINYDILPGYAHADVTLTIADESIVALDGHSTSNTFFWLLPKAVGTTTVTVSTPDGLSATMTVNVKERPELERIEMYDRTGIVGSTVNFYANAYPDGATAYFNFTIADTSIARIQSSWSEGCDVILLKEGTTTITATDPKTGLTATATIHAVVPTEITNGYSETVTFTSPDSSAYYLFTPEVTDTYLLTSANGQWCYSYFNIRPENGGEYPEYDSYDVDGTTRCYAQLKAGTTYRIELRAYEASQYSFSLQTAPELNSVAFERSEYTLYYNADNEWFNQANLWLNLDPADGYESYTVTSSDPKMVAIGYVGVNRVYIGYNGTGEYTITLTTASGKKTECKLNILEAPDVESLEVELYSNGIFIPGNWFNLGLHASPEGSCPEVTATSSNPKVAEIYAFSVSGTEWEVEILGYGTTTFTFTDKNTGATTSYTIEVKEPKAIELGYSETLTLAPETSELLAFTPAESGWYKLTSQEVDCGLEYLVNFYFDVMQANGRYLDSNNCYYGDDLLRGFVYLEQGEEYRIAVRNHENVEITSQVTLTKAEAVTGFELVEESMTVTQRGYGEFTYTAWANFTPYDSYEEITWTVSDPEVLMIRWTGGRVCEFNAMKAGTVTLTAKTESGLEDSMIITVKPAIPLELDNRTTIEVQPGWNNPDAVAFTPSESGRYCFTVERGGDSWFYLNTEGYWNNDVAHLYSDFGNHVLMDCVAGMTYYLEVINEGDVADNATVYVEKAVEATGLNLAYGTGWFEDGTPIVVVETQFIPYNSSDPVVKWDVQNNGTLKVHYDSSYNLTCEVIGNGTCTITATTASGLTATVTIPVSDGTDLCPNGHTAEVLPGKAATCTETGLSNGSVCSVCGTVLEDQQIIPALGHDYTRTVTTEPTCTTAGSATYTCDRCDHSYTEEIAALGHDYEAKVTAPTCTEAGFTTHTCKACGDSYTTDLIEALGHSYNSVVTHPTCTEAGFTTYTCENCKDTYVEDEVEALGHNFYAAAGNDPTCVEDGLVEYACSNCMDPEVTYRDVIPALGHTEVIDEGIAPTCTEAGISEGKHCSACEEILVKQEVLPALGHKLVIKAYQEPTCTESGWTEGRSCSVCNEMLQASVEIPAVGHLYQTTDKVNFKCYKCDDAFTVTVKDIVESLDETSNEEEIDEAVAKIQDIDAEHLETAMKENNQNPTEEDQEGILEQMEKLEELVKDSKNIELEIVSDVFDASDVGIVGAMLNTPEDSSANIAFVITDAEDQTIEIPDDYSQENAIKFSMTLENVEETAKLEVPVQIKLPIPAGLDVDRLVVLHYDNSGNVKETIYPTVVVENDVVYACFVVTGFSDFAMAEASHKLAEKAFQDATCTLDGNIRYYYCTDEDCGKIFLDQDGKVAATLEDVKIIAKGHTEEVIPAVAATCTATGLTEGKKCSVCGEILVAQAVVEKLPHTEESIPAVAATCTATGLTEGKKCSVCGEILVAQETAAKLPHTEVTIPGKAATETETGLTDGKKCSVCGEITLEQKVIDKLPPSHVHDYKAVVTAPTCVTKGYTTYTCSCGDSYTADETAIVAHTYGAWETTKLPTVKEAGEAKQVCSVCGKTETKVLEKLSEGFVDVVEDDWFATQVAWAVSEKITTGTSATTFAPYAECTRAQVVTFLWRAAGEPKPTSSKNPFTDVKSDAYYYNAVLWAVEKGITSGMSATSFAPDTSCTRAQVVTFLWRAAGEPKPTSSKNPFTDVKSDAYYYNAVLWAVEKEITTGMTITTFEPDGVCNRAQIVTFLYRYINN